MQVLLAVLVGLHGIAHLPGFAVPWGLLHAEELGDGRRLLRGRVELSPLGARGVGVCWLLVGIAFCAAAAAMATGWPGWPAAVAGASLGSLVLTLLFLPQARIGALIDAALIAILAASAL